MEEQKMETVPKNFRLPKDVIEILRKTAEETGQSETQVICVLVRESMEDANRVLQRQVEGAIQVMEEGGSAIHLRLPRNRDELADAMTLLMRETAERIGERDRISALGVARARVYKLTEAYQGAEEVRKREGRASIYEDEKKLAEGLSRG